MMRSLLILLSFVGAAHAEPWDRIDTALGAAALTATVIDWGQTRYIAKHPCPNAGDVPGCTDPYRETWPVAKRVIGEHPSVGQVDAYFVAYIASTLLIADWLSPRNRKLWLGFVSVVEIKATTHNRSIGVKVAL